MSLAGGSDALCCLALTAPALLWVLPVSMRRRLWGGEGVCVRGVGLGVMFHRHLPSRHISWRVSRRRLRAYGWSWGAGRLGGVNSLGLERIGQHGFPCGLWHPAPRRLFSADPLRGRWTRPSRKGSARAQLRKLPELRVGRALPPLSLGGAVALGGGVGVGGCDGVVGTGGGGVPGRFPVVLRRGNAWGVGARADVDSRVRAHGLRLRIWLTHGGGGSGAFAVFGLTSTVGRGAGTLLVDPGAVLVWSGLVPGPGVWALRGGGTKRVAPRPRRALP